jgi:hypothetical protein
MCCVPKLPPTVPSAIAYINILIRQHPTASAYVNIHYLTHVVSDSADYYSEPYLSSRVLCLNKVREMNIDYRLTLQSP